MLRYQFPPIEDMLQMADKLDASYKNSGGKNNQRKDFILLMQQLTQHIKHQYEIAINVIKSHPDLTDEMRSDRLAEKEAEYIKMLTGAAVFELEFVSNEEYSGRAPGVTNYFFFKKGSTLCEDIIKQLGINTLLNPLNDDERMICLFKFYKFIEQHQDVFAAEKFKSDDFKNKNKLLLVVKKTVKKLYDKESQRIKSIVEGRPVFAALKSCVNELHDKYNQVTQSRRRKNTKREKLCTLIDFVTETSNELYSDAVLPADDPRRDHLRAQHINTMLGLVLFVLMRINKEYRWLYPDGGWFNSGSELFKQCKEAINVKNLDKLDDADKLEWLKALATHMQNIGNNEKYCQRKVDEWEKKGFKEFDFFKEKIENYHHAQKHASEQPSRAATMIATGTSYAAQWGIGILATTYATELVLPTLTVGLGAAAGPVGWVIYGAGAVVMTGISHLMKDAVLPKAASWAYAWMLDKIGSAIGNTVAGVATYTFTATSAGIKALMNHADLKAGDRELMQEWLDTLLSLPHDIMPEEEKSQLRKVLGLKDQPVQQLQVLESPPEKKMAMGM